MSFSPTVTSPRRPVFDAEIGLECSATTLVDARIPASVAMRKERRPCLKVLAGAQIGTMFEVARGGATIGRSRDCEVVLRTHGISRRHCRLWLDDGEAFVEDLSSTNGTYVNGAQVTRLRLSEGDRLRLGGSTVIRFAYQDPDEVAAHRRLYDAAMRDPLTAAFNKRYFDARLESELAFAERHGTELSVIVLDIDHFKRVNDTYGHLTGDTVLTQLVELLRASLRAEDILARIGGEEFAILARSLDLEQSIELAERIRRLVAGTTFRDRSLVVPVTISLGLSTFHRGTAPAPNEFLRQADEALYQAKNAGRNRLATAIPATRSRA